jgi:hypothetical protein
VLFIYGVFPYFPIRKYRNEEKKKRNKGLIYWASIIPRGEATPAQPATYPLHTHAREERLRDKVSRWKLRWCAAAVLAPVWCRAALLRLLLSVAWYLGPLLHAVHLLLGSVLWTFPAAPILALVSPSTFRWIRLRRAVSYPLPLSTLHCSVQSASFVLGCDCTFWSIKQLNDDKRYSETRT